MKLMMKMKMMTTKGKKVKKKCKRTFLSLSLSLFSLSSVKAPLQVRPVDPLQRDHERRRPQRQVLLLRDAPQVRERRRHRLVEAPLDLLGAPLEVLDVLDPLEERDGDAAAAGELFFFVVVVVVVVLLLLLCCCCCVVVGGGGGGVGEETE